MRKGDACSRAIPWNRMSRVGSPAGALASALARRLTEAWFARLLAIASTPANPVRVTRSAYAGSPPKPYSASDLAY